MKQYSMNQGKEIIALYKENPSQGIEPYLKGLIFNYKVWIYKETGEMKYYSSPSEKPKRTFFSNEDVERVLAGGTYSELDDFGPHLSNIVGLPFQVDGKPYALFLKLNLELGLKGPYRFLQLFLVFVIGAMLILIGARYLVKPIKAMTLATRKIARGNFDVQLPIKNMDELGTLAESFNSMAKELRELEQMRQDFVSNVSHEIQSPLTSLRGYSQILKDETLTTGERKEFLQIVEQEINRLSRLSENLLKLASLESNHHPYHPEVYLLDEQLRGLVVLMEPQWAKKHLKMMLSLEKVECFGDQDLLNQVWVNILTNSIKFTPDGGQIHIKLTVNDQRVIVEIADSGAGMATEVQARIFERFYTGNTARERQKNGNGLGLSIVKKIVDIHNGEIEVASKEGEGTKFIVKLPN